MCKYWIFETVILDLKSDVCITIKINNAQDMSLITAE